jgi:polyphosphate glucokinase
LELGALSYGKGTIEDYLGRRGLKKLGKKKWRKLLKRLVARFTSAFLLDDVVIGGGEAKNLKKAPPGCRLGSNANAFIGGFRMWGSATDRKATLPNGPGKGGERESEDDSNLSAARQALGKTDSLATGSGSERNKQLRSPA